MRLRWALILIAVVPLLLAGMAVAWMVQQRSQVVAELQSQAVEPVLLASRKAELQKYVNLARSAVQHLVRDGMPDARAQAQALEILKRLEFGHDGYFFVFDFDGNNLLYPRRPQLQGRNLLDLQDRDGGYPVRRLIDQARTGGGYVEFEWDRPSTGQLESKLGYVEPIAGWQWVLGTGTYVDEPERARKRIAEASSEAVVDTLGRIGAITLLSTVAVVALALGVNLNEQRKADAQLRAMARQIVTSQEAERARVARELHDGVSQWLVSVKYLFESAQDRARRAGAADAELVRTLDAGVQRLREVLGEVRRISHDLRPALLDDLGLARALEHLAREWGQRCGIAVDVACDDAPDVPEAAATALFRVAQEALGNVERHAQARQVRLRLERRGTSLRFELEDDGRGFDADALQRTPREGLGLTHMRERIESLGGRFELASSAAGTRLAAVFPERALQA
jgi:two-component system, NarL family, sensor kinase